MLLSANLPSKFGTQRCYPAVGSVGNAISFPLAKTSFKCATQSETLRISCPLSHFDFLKVQDDLTHPEVCFLIEPRFDSRPNRVNLGVRGRAIFLYPQ